MRLRRVAMLAMLCGSPALAQAQAPAEPQPVPLGISGQLTPWLQVRGEFRTRIEGFTGGGFGDTKDAYWMDRFRLNATVRPAKSLAFVVQAQDARTFDKTAGSQAAPFRDTLDLRMAYGEIGSKHTVRIGRQELAFGEQRLLGHLAWVNTARSFDGARATIKGKLGQIDGFAASVVTIDPEGFDKSGNGNLICRHVRLAHHRGSEADPRAVFFLAAVPELHRRTGRRRRSPSGDERRAHGGKGALGIGLFRRAGRPDRLGRTRRCHGVGRPRRCRQDAERRTGAPAAVRGIQLRLGRRRSRPTARAGRSISSIRPDTTSSACPIRSAGRTSTTPGPASRFRPTRRSGWWRAAITRGGSRARPTASTARAARSWRGPPPARREATSARKSTPRCRSSIRRSFRSAADTRISFQASF